MHGGGVTVKANRNRSWRLAAAEEEDGRSFQTDGRREGRETKRLNESLSLSSAGEMGKEAIRDSFSSSLWKDVEGRAD